MEEKYLTTSDKNEILGAINDLTESVNAFATNTEERFGAIDQRFDRLEKDVGTMKATMVTKDYLDEKMNRLHGNMVAMVRKEDEKVDSFVDLMSDKKILTKPEAKKLVLMGPFPKAR